MCSCVVVWGSKRRFDISETRKLQCWQKSPRRPPDYTGTRVMCMEHMRHARGRKNSREHVPYKTLKCTKRGGKVKNGTTTKKSKPNKWRFVHHTGTQVHRDEENGGSPPEIRDWEVTRYKTLNYHTFLPPTGTERGQVAPLILIILKWLRNWWLTPACLYSTDRLHQVVSVGLLALGLLQPMYMCIRIRILIQGKHVPCGDHFIHFMAQQ